MSQNYKMPEGITDSNNIIYLLERQYEINGLRILKVAADELRRLYDLFNEEAIQLDQFHDGITIRMGVVMKLACKYFGIGQQELVSQSRTLKVMLPRHVTMYLAKELTDLSYPQIGAWFNRDHTTVVHAYQKMTEQLQSNPTVKKMVDEITILCQKEALEEHKRIQEMKLCQKKIANLSLRTRLP